MTPTWNIEIRVVQVCARDGLTRNPACRYTTLKIGVEDEEVGSIWSRSGANLKSQYSCGAQNGTILTHVNPGSRYQVYSLSRGFPGKGIRLDIGTYHGDTSRSRRTGILQDHIWAGNRRVTDSGEFLLNMKRCILGHILFVCISCHSACGRSKHANTGFINCALFCTR